jgi:pimeloyl-ACP methyl ester carboxylesterase
VDERRLLTPVRATATSFDGVPLAYTTCGTGGPALVFVHGWSCHQGFWREQLALGDAYRVIALDLAGHGPLAADAPRRTDWSMAAFARDVEAVLEATGTGDAVFVGHSMGGAVCVEAALRLGRRCRLVLGIDTFTDARFYRRRPAPEIAARRARFAAAFQPEVARMVGAITAPRTPAATVRWIADAMSATRVDDALDALGALLAWDIEERWPALSAPVTTINATMLAAPEHAIDLERLHVHAMDGVGHFPMLEAPARFNALVRDLTTRA